MRRETVDEKEKQPKRYYWLRLRNDYFGQLEQKKLKRCEQGKYMQLIYIRMMLLSVDKAGMIYFQGIYDTLQEELAEILDEPVELISKTLKFMVDNRMATIDENNNCFIPEVLKITGSECYSAERMRRHREKIRLSQGNTPVTNCDTAVMPCDEEDIAKNNYIISKNKSQRENTNSRMDEIRKVVAAWNSLEVHGIPRITEINPHSFRYQMLTKLLEENTLENILTAIDNIRVSTFLCGNNAVSWTISFDWFIKIDNFIKVLEGNYNVFNVLDSQKQQQTPVDILREMNRNGVFDDEQAGNQ